MSRLVGTTCSSLLASLLIAAGNGPGAVEALAAPPKGVALKEAARLTARGESLWQRKQYTAAIAMFQEAYSHSPHPILWWNIARCYEEAGDLDKALDVFRSIAAISQVEARKLAKADRALPARALEKVRALEKRTEVVRTVTPVPEAETTPSPAPTTVIPAPPPPKPLGEPTAVAAVPQARPLRSAGWVMFAVAVATAAGGAACVVVADQNYARVVQADEQGGVVTGINQVDASTAEAVGNQYAAIGWTLVGVAGASLITSVALLIADARRPQASSSSSLHGFVIPWGGGLILGGRSGF